MALIDTLDKAIFQVSSKDTEEGFQIVVKIQREVLEQETELIDQAITDFTFEVLLPIRYPFIDPQIMCLSSFAHSFLSLDDGRDIFNEVVGEQGWRVGFKLQTLIQLLPDFIQEMAIIEDNLHVIGCFHLG